MAQYILSDEREEPTTKKLYPVRLWIRFDEEIKSFSEKQELREFSTTK